MKKKIWKIAFSLLLILLSLLVVNLYLPKLAALYYTKTFKSAKTADTECFERLLRNAAYESIKNETWNVPLGSYKSLLEYYNRDVSVYEYGEFGLLMYYSLLYGQQKNDKDLCNLVKKKFDSCVLQQGGVKRNDQTTYGLVALDLYCCTHDKRYKKYADGIYARLDSLDKSDGIVIYNNKHNEQRVDGIGLVCPFLFYYSTVFGNNSARKIANKMTWEFVRYGTDSESGIPSKAYGLKSHIKHISPNWGRGISWYLLGMNQMDRDDELIVRRMELLDSVLLTDDDYLYQQFFDEKGLPDMSTTIPVIWHLCSSGKMSMTRDELTRLVSPYCDRKGIVRYCSGVVSSKTGVDNMQSNLFVQGLLLYMYSQLK